MADDDIDINKSMKVNASLIVSIHGGQLDEMGQRVKEEGTLAEK